MEEGVFNINCEVARLGGGVFKNVFFAENLDVFATSLSAGLRSAVDD